jgi:hypothetical protein
LAVSYEELEGSPKIKMDRKGGSATRMFKIAWVDIKAFFVELFPRPLAGYPPASWVPGYAWMRAQSAEAEPFNSTRPGGVNVGSDITYSDTARVSVEYGPPDMDQEQQPVSTEGEDGGGEDGGGGDGTGPGGDEGATGGEKGTTEQPVTLLEHSVHVGAEFLTISSLILEWEKEPKETTRKVRAGKLVPTMEHQITWNNVQTPPWWNIRRCNGRVNDGSFLGAPVECVLFVGCDANRTITNDGKKAWTLKYKFSEKQIEPTKGWNYFYRAEKDAPLRLDKLRVGEGVNARYIYELSNLSSLYNGQVVPF